MGKCSKIRHIVRLRQMLRRWRIRACTRSSSSSSSSTPSDVPAGHVAVCVGSTSRRFVVRAAHLNHPIFRKLLVQAEEEYGFSYPGPLFLTCDESLFEHILCHVTTSSSTTGTARFAANLDDLCSCHVGLRSTWQQLQQHDALPLLHGFPDKSVW